MLKFRIHFPTLFAILFTLAVLFLSFFWFSFHSDQMIESTTKFYLETNAKSQAAAFNTKLSNQIEMLQTVSRIFKYCDMTNHDALRKTAMQIENFGNFARISAAGPDGRLFDTTGKDLGDISQSLYFKRSLKGLVTISDTVLTDIEIGDYLYIALPIYQEENNVGVMLGQFSISVLSELIEAVGFQETSTSILLTSDGMILARSTNNELVTPRIRNFFDLGTKWGLHDELSLTNIKVDIMSGKTLTIPYATGSRNRLAILTPVKINNWYYAIVISQDIIDRQSHALSINLLVVESVLIFALLILFIAVMHLFKRMSCVKMANDRFQMVTRQSQAIVFDYDFTKRQVDFTGTTKFVNKNAKESYTNKEIITVMSNILHENDKSIIEEIIGLRNNEKNTILREMRILCADNKYYWHRLTGTVVRDDEGYPRRLVGNLVNVEDEIDKDEQLPQKTELDQLSGLLNKQAFTDSVSELLSKSNTDNVFALYLINLDNFKAVNDTLGHTIGDHVLSDVSKKLCTIFSKDDFVGRTGGDEFAAFLNLSGTGLSMAIEIIEGKAKAVMNLLNEVYSDGKIEVNTSSSIGVAIFPNNGKKFDELYKNAVKALYKSKKDGKNQYTICK